MCSGDLHACQPQAQKIWKVMLSILSLVSVESMVEEISQR